MITQTKNLNRNELTPLMRLNASLKALPAPGHGYGCHNGLLGCANLARRVGLHRTEAFCRLRNAIKPGPREVLDDEIRDAINLAYTDTHGSRPRPAATRRTNEPGGPSFDSEAERNRIIQAGAGWDEATWMAASPTPIPEAPAEQTQLVLRELFSVNEFVFVGERWGTSDSVLRVEQWAGILAEFAGTLNPPHVIPNPLTGDWAAKSSGGGSKRCDEAVAKYRIAVAEFDGLSREEQLAFWAGFGRPLVALVDSGGKSVHAWLKVDCADAQDWGEQVGKKLYGDRLIPLGVDPACRNPSRLSRLPGITRDNGNIQNLLYLKSMENR